MHNNIQHHHQVRPFLPKEIAENGKQCISQVAHNPKQLMLGKKKAFTFDDVFPMDTTNVMTTHASVINRHKFTLRVLHLLLTISSMATMLLCSHMARQYVTLLINITDRGQVRHTRWAVWVCRAVITCPPVSFLLCLVLCLTS